jgi:hypothetical protein
MVVVQALGVESDALRLFVQLGRRHEKAADQHQEGDEVGANPEPHRSPYS